MKPAQFDYLAPDTLEAVLAALAEHGDEAKLLAGGQSLIPAMNFRLMQPAMLVDVNRLAGLDYVRQSDDGELRIGAMTRQRTLERDSLVEETSPLLYETAPHIAHPQIRNRGTVGGNLAHADPASELPAVALALRARFRAQSAEGERWIPADEFFFGMFATDLEPEEMLVEIAIPAMPLRTGWAFMEFSRRKGDYALMGVAALATLDESGVCQEARLVYLNAGDGPVDAQEAAQLLVGESASEAAFEAAAVKAAQEEIDPFGSLHATIDYQRHLARVLTQRALKLAFERAGTNGNGS